MITERVGDLLTEPGLTHVAHQANLYCSFGAGLALQIARKWPHAAARDGQTAPGDRRKLGTYTTAEYPRGSGKGPVVVNLYSQSGSYRQSDRTDYVALRRALTDLERELRGRPGVRLGLPHGLGCGLAGGSWPKVYGILEAVFGDSPVAVVVVRLPEAA